MLEEFKNMIKESSTILIEGESGAGKTLLASMLAIEKAKEGKKCLFLSFLKTELIVKGLKDFFGEEFEKVFKNGLFFGQIELGDEEEFFEDIHYALIHFKPDIIIIDPLHPLISQGILRDICNTIKLNNSCGIFCSLPKPEFHALVDYVITILSERVKGNIKRELSIKAKNEKIEKTFSFSISPGFLHIEEQRD